MYFFAMLTEIGCSLTTEEFVSEVGMEEESEVVLTVESVRCTGAALLRGMDEREREGHVVVGES